MIEIKISQGKTAFVDDEDGWLAGFQWAAAKQGSRWYAIRNIPRGDGGGTITLHRMVLKLPDGGVVDHIDGDGLNCRRANLRAADLTTNAWNRRKRSDNTSGFKGVTKSPARCRKPWMACATANGKPKYLGTFATKEEAARAYDAAARELHGEFARVNFPMENQ